jgi:hypothetical protein
MSCRRVSAAIAGLIIGIVSVRPARGQSVPPASTRPDSLVQGNAIAAGRGDGGQMEEPLGIPHSRTGSGTSWVPDASNHRDYQHMAGSWMLMLHGVADFFADRQDGPRGATQVGSTNWVMGMAMRTVGEGVLHLDGMLSVEPLTVGNGGYPLLLQSGETFGGQPLHDRQHPHNLFMELSTMYERPIGRGLAISVYVAPVGEPALGPVAFMHRPSAQSDPFANIAHHWQDVTHITFGVATVGIYSRVVKLEASVFNGREPDEDRYAIELRPLDSWSVRFDANPTAEWSLNASAGLLKSPEALHPDVSQRRIGASIMRTSGFGTSGEWASALIYGANQPIALGVSQPIENSVVAETNLDLDGRNTVYGRLTWVQKTADELAVPGLPADQRFGLATVSVGYSRELFHIRHTAIAVGMRGEVGQVPVGLQPTYGTRNPLGFAVYLRVRPAVSASMAGMDMSMPMGMRDAR